MSILATLARVAAFVWTSYVASAMFFLLYVPLNGNVIGFVADYRLLSAIDIEEPWLE